jgi:hypothetical protein
MRQASPSLSSLVAERHLCIGSTPLISRSDFVPIEIKRLKRYQSFIVSRTVSAASMSWNFSTLPRRVAFNPRDAIKRLRAIRR